MMMKIKSQGMILKISCKLNDEEKKIEDIDITIILENERDQYYSDKINNLLTYAANLDIYKILKAYEKEIEETQLRFYGKDMVIILGDKKTEIKKGKLIRKCSYEYWDNQDRVSFETEVRDDKPFEFDPKIPEDVISALAGWDHYTTIISETSQGKLFKISLKDCKHLLKDRKTEVEI